MHKTTQWCEGTGLAAPVRDHVAQTVEEFAITTEAIRADRRLSALGRAEALRAAEAAAEARLAELGDVRKPAGAAAARLTEASAAASTKIARSLEPPPEEARFVVAALDRLGRLSPTEQQRALNSALLAAGGSDPEAKRNAVTLLQAARRLDDVPASLRTEISGTLRSALAPAEVAAEAEALADQANFVANVRRNAADTMAKLAREV